MTRVAAFKWLKSYLPTWPDYVLRDWMYNYFRGDWDASGDNPQTVIQRTLDGEGMTPQTRWKFVPDFHFTFDSLDPDTVRRIKEHQGGAVNPYGIPNDAERHATQATLAAQQGGVRDEPVILKKVGNKYELIEGWHRTIQHFKQFPDGYKGPAWIALDAKPVNPVPELVDSSADMLSMDPWTFDQSQSGWRSLPAGQQTDMLKRYIARYVTSQKTWAPDTPKGDKPLDPYLLVWHLGQVLALNGDTKGAVTWMQQSTTGEKHWDDYVAATIAFLLGDRKWFFAHSADASNYNADTMARLRRGWGKSYRDVYENFADGKGPGRQGDSQRHGIPKHATMAQLEKAAKAPGRKGQLARWQINMRRGKKNKSMAVTEASSGAALT